MFIELTPQQRQLQAELRQYFSNLISSDEMKAMEQDRHNAAYRAVIRRMGQDGKLGVGWPKEFGGLGFGPIEQQIFVNEAHRADRVGEGAGELHQRPGWAGEGVAEARGQDHLRLAGLVDGQG